MTKNTLLPRITFDKTSELPLKMPEGDEMVQRNPWCDCVQPITNASYRYRSEAAVPDVFSALALEAPLIPNVASLIVELSLFRLHSGTHGRH
jgi:hypothetical protein